MNRKRVLKVVIILIIGSLAIFGVHQYRTRTITAPDFVTGQEKGEVIFDIAQGESGSEIAMNLLKAGVVKSSTAFFRLAVVDKRSGQIAPGSHRISMHIPAAVALDQLLDPNRITSLVKIKEGAWVSEIVTELVKAGFDENTLVKGLSEISLPVGFHGAEGILFPAQYSFAKGTSPVVALQSMVTAFSNAAHAAGIDSPSSEFTPMQLLTIASLVQAEGDVQDFTKISRVIRNRLKLGMPLQFDTTVHFVTHTRGKVFLSTDATKTPSLYNTYLHVGLPPGPIGSPGLAAMKASIAPAVGDWIYFITVKPGDTRFTSSSNQFLTWKSEYEKNLRAGAFA
jgi:UPF0755 protein